MPRRLMVNELDIIKVINKNIINDLQFFAEHDNSFFLSGFTNAFSEYNGGVLFQGVWYLPFLTQC